MPGRPPLRILVAIALVAGCTLALQVLLTRLFASVFLYHLAFLAVSLALLGVGSGALFVYVRPQWFAGPVVRRIADWCALVALTLVLLPAVAVRIHYPPQSVLSASFVATLAAVCVLAFLPFLAAGIAVALAVRHYVGSIGLLYAFDLAGAGLGALVIVPLLWLVDVPVLVVCLAGVAAAASLLAGWGSGAGTRLRAGVAGVVAVAIAFAFATSFDFLPFTTAVHLPRPAADRWGPISRVLGYGPSAFGAALLDSPPGRAPAVMLYDRDGAPVPRYQRGEPYPDWRALKLGPQSVGYALGRRGDALIIGGGGGRDIFNALSSGQRLVDVIELNRGIRQVVNDDLARWSGSPYTLPGVHTVIGDGRSTLAARHRQYDHVQINYTNTLSAGTGASFALTENNLYTVEAVREYLHHVRPGGVLGISRLYKLSGLEALRATVLALEALRRDGVGHPERNVVVILGFTGPGLFSGTVLLKHEAFTAAELGRIRRLGAERGNGVAFAPGGPYQLEWQALAAAPDPVAFCHGFRVDVCAPTDDRPFFSQATRLTNLGGAELGYSFRPDPYVLLLAMVGLLAALCALAFIVPLGLSSRDVARPPSGPLLFFAAIGAGYLTLEVCLIQRFVLFLGFPTYALSVVLFSLLVFTGVGAAFTEMVRSPSRVLPVALGAAVGLIVLAAFGLQPLLGALIDLPFAARALAAVALVAPVGLLAGMAMPLGLRRLSALTPAAVPWAWGINGFASVLASALAIVVAITAGFRVTTLVAAGFYLAALCHALWGRWPASSSPS